MGSGQAVRRLPLEQEIEGSNPSSPAMTCTKEDISVLPFNKRELMIIKQVRSLYNTE